MHKESKILHDDSPLSNPPSPSVEFIHQWAVEIIRRCKDHCSDTYRPPHCSFATAPTTSLVDKTFHREKGRGFEARECTDIGASWKPSKHHTSFIHHHSSFIGSSSFIQLQRSFLQKSAKHYLQIFSPSELLLLHTPRPMSQKYSSNEAKCSKIPLLSTKLNTICIVFSIKFHWKSKKNQQNRINIKKMRRDQESRMFAVVVWRGLPVQCPPRSWYNFIIFSLVCSRQKEHKPPTSLSIKMHSTFSNLFKRHRTTLASPYHHYPMEDGRFDWRGATYFIMYSTT